MSAKTVNFPSAADTLLVMTQVLPTVQDAGRLLTELRFVRPQDREDAAQEAWVAYLEGREVARAVGTFAQRLRRQRQRVVVNSEALLGI